MAERAIDRVERLVCRAAFRQLGRNIDLVAGRASSAWCDVPLNRSGVAAFKLLSVSLGLIGRMALHAGRVVEILRARW